MTVVPIGINDVETTVELAGQLETSDEHEVTVVISVLYMVTVISPGAVVVGIVSVVVEVVFCASWAGARSAKSTSGE